MRRFLYFIPGPGGGGRQRLSKIGLIDRFVLAPGSSELCPITTGQIDDSPWGHGTMVAPGEQPGFIAPNQRWEEGPGYRVGIEDPSAPPRPEDLARDIVIQGWERTLADGRTWLCPVLHRWGPTGPEPNLPQALVPNLAGGRYRLEQRIRPEFEAADRMATAVFEHATHGRQIEQTELVEMAVKILAINSRIGMPEIALLGLFDQSNWMDVLYTAIDHDQIVAAAAAAAQTGLQRTEPLIAQED